MKIVNIWMVTDKEHKTFLYELEDGRYVVMLKNRVTGEDSRLLTIPKELADNYISDNI